LLDPKCAVVEEELAGWGAAHAEYAAQAMPATPTATPIAPTAEELAAVRYNADGLVAAIVQEEGTGRVLMLAWMNAEALERTLDTGRTWFWSRSRQEFWCKGETSGDRQWVRAAYYDCDGDALLFVVEQEGRGACHTGERSCFFRPFGADGAVLRSAEPSRAGAEGAMDMADGSTPGVV
jgi:phosphoribosyl-AMP cyclohydrolase/phosphoribosyl-ATP pyrophosphohydrolase/phosphoribosyl-AMP cyclohydrolase